ncbi:hypothetical protein DesfrDRAFT_1194 [Solidesulfovibrio fructosivorans JJ]]|uniref:DUF2635 domain-containing protein n=1 Tax=Solidesulfovibrio fructosivorans JJ] TaxID=596151 RepID=E1JU95_SOLFR|nr:hypothetical protein [Solidesulfovibrio fructosivorans]EFL52025.1 hypothetical protein DesfrDRAFT_1194 [Solidesulfovibrio fructosivorans JJ]]
MTTITVRAAPGLRVPMEGMPRRHITEDTAVAVSDSAYYRRRVADGDLLPRASDKTTTKAATAKPAPKTAKKKEA